MSRWAGDIMGTLVSSTTRKRHVDESPEDGAFAPPRKRTRTAANQAIIDVNSESDTDKCPPPPPPPKRLSKAELAAIARDKTLSGLKNQVKTLTKDLSKMTAKADKAQHALVSDLEKRVGGSKTLQFSAHVF